MNLLEGIDKFGYGNWKEVKQYMDYLGCPFSQKQLKEHYDEFYLQNEDYSPILSDCCQLVYHKQKQYIQQVQPQKQIEQLPCESISIYNSKRGQFLSEADPEAELLIANLQFCEAQSENQTQMKYKLIEQYLYRIQQRQKKKQLVIEHKLLDEQQIKMNLQKGVSLAKTICLNQIIPFSRYNTYQEQQKIVKSLTLKMQITQLTNQLVKRPYSSFDHFYRKMEDKKFKRIGQIKSQAIDLKIQRFSATENDMPIENRKRSASENDVKFLQNIARQLDGNKFKNCKKTILRKAIYDQQLSL